VALHPAEAGYNEGFERKRAAHWEAPDKQPSNGWTKDDHPVQGNKQFGPVPPADPELVKVLAAIKPTFAPYEEVMMILRFKVYDLITEHVPDRDQALLLKKIVEQTFR
jgi:hypothetical protein